MRNTKRAIGFSFVATLLCVLWLWLSFPNAPKSAETPPSEPVAESTPPRPPEVPVSKPPPASPPAPRDLGEGFEPLGKEVGIENLPKRVRHKPTGIVLVLVPPGSYTMGSPENESNRDWDEAQREMDIEKPFYLSETEVTIDAWRRVMGDNSDTEGLDGQLPMSGVSWHNAADYAKQLNEQGGSGWRLPTEVEWEYACRAGTTTPFSFGENISSKQANFNARRRYNRAEAGERSDGPMPVRSYPPNDFGFYEMHGNVWEWCADRYVPRPERGETAGTAGGGSRVMRGGAWTSLGKQLRSGYRDGYQPGSSGEKYGFRVARTIDL